MYKYIFAVSPLPSPSKSPAKSPIQAQKKPCCTALYDFEPENPGELGFKVKFTLSFRIQIDDCFVNEQTCWFQRTHFK